jgi:hypothetical protein
MRIHTADGAGAGVGYVDLHYNANALNTSNPYSWSYEGAGYEHYWRDFGAGQPIQKETWEIFEWAVTMDNVPMSAGGTARVLFWKNGQLVLDIKNARTLTDPNGYATKYMLFTYWNGNAQRDAHIFVDDLTITTKVPTKLDSNGNPFLGR